MRSWITAALVLLVADFAHAQELVRAEPAARAAAERVQDAPEDAAELAAAQLAQALEARAEETLDRRVALAAQRAVALLEARAAERLAGLAVRETREAPVLAQRVHHLQLEETP